MLSPSTRQLEAPSRNSRPIRNACARPSGLGCTAYSIFMPHCEPSPSSCWNSACSCGVLITSTSRLPASISRSEEHTSELQSLMRISYAVYCLQKKHIDSIKQTIQQLQ